MKKIAVFSALLLVIMLVLPSCEKETLLTVDQTSISFTDSGGSQTVTLTANKPWSVSSTQSWCKVSPSGGEEAAGSRISISCDANTTYDARTCTVTFTCAEMTKSVTVSQATNNGLQVSQTTYEVTKAAQQLNIEVKANVKFSVEVDNGCKDWVKYNTTKALTTSTVVLDIAENKTYDSREGKVTIKQDGGSLSSTITIKQSQLDGLFLTTSEYNLSNEKHTLTVEVSTNVELEVKSEADWVKYVQTKGLNTKQIVLEVAENDTFDQRETKVNVKQKNGDLGGTITIKQDEKYGILVSQSEYDLTNEAQTIVFTVKYNVDFEVVIPDDCKSWIKQVSTKTLNNKTFSFSISQNDAYYNREGSITFKQKNGPFCETVIIRQSQTDYLSSEYAEYEVSYEEQILTIIVKSNIDYQVKIDESSSDWLSLVSSKALTDSTISFGINTNLGEERSSVVVLVGDNLSNSFVIKQKAEGYVEFEDVNFEKFCVDNFDANGDGKVSYTEAKNVTGISIYTEDISSLKGIEFFPNLVSLKCTPHYNMETWSKDGGCFKCDGEVVSGLLTYLDLSNNAKLAYLNCEGNHIHTLILNENSPLEEFNCKYNPITQLDLSNFVSLSKLVIKGTPIIIPDYSIYKHLYYLDCTVTNISELDVSGNAILRTLNCGYNNLYSLDVSKNTLLEWIECGVNNLKDIDISHNESLKRFTCRHNKLYKLDVTHNTLLTDLDCENCELTTIDLTKNSQLTWINCSNNPITELDLSNNSNLGVIYCRSLNLYSLDLSNNLVLYYVACTGNPNLTEIWLKTGQTIQTMEYNTSIATIKYK